MKPKLDYSIQFLILNYFLILWPVPFVHAAKLTFLIESFPQSSVIVGKSREEAEMAYFTQKFYFVRKKDVLGGTMLKFLRKYVEMQKGNNVTQILHWLDDDKNQNTKQYKNRGKYCSDYLRDKTFQDSGIYYDPDPGLSRITESDMLVIFDYYTRIHRPHRVLQCPVKVNQQSSQLFFMSFFKNDNRSDTSYFVLASKSTNELAPLYVLMYINRKRAKGKEIKPANVPSSSGQEEQVLDERIRTSPIDFRRIIKVLKESDDSKITVWMGKAAERVFITSNNYYFINLGLDDWLVDRFNQVMENMRKQNEIEFFTRQDEKFKSEACSGHIRYNPALSLRDYTPDIGQINKGRGVQIVTRRTSFPHTQLPEFTFKVPMLACPALFGPNQEPKIVYIQILKDPKTNSINWMFALLESSRRPDTVYPATFSAKNSAFNRQVFEQMNEEVPPIDEGINEASQSTDDTFSFWP